MDLFERMSRVASAELSYRMSQSVDSEQEINRTIMMLQDAVVKTRLALAKAPADQRNNLMQNLTNLQAKLADIKARKDLLKSRAVAAKANEQLQSTISRLNTGSVMPAFERLEEKFLMIRAISQAAGESVDGELESQFAMLESGSDVDDELAAMKAQLISSSISRQVLSIAEEKQSPTSKSMIDDKLKALRKQIDNL